MTGTRRAALAQMAATARRAYCTLNLVMVLVPALSETE
jgi:hypothetical protein